MSSPIMRNRRGMSMGGEGRRGGKGSETDLRCGRGVMVGTRDSADQRGVRGWQGSGAVASVGSVGSRKPSIYPHSIRFPYGESSTPRTFLHTFLKDFLQYQTPPKWKIIIHLSSIKSTGTSTPNSEWGKGKWMGRTARTRRQTDGGHRMKANPRFDLVP